MNEDDGSRKAMVVAILALFLMSGMYFYFWTVSPVRMAAGEIEAGDEGLYVKVEGAVQDPDQGREHVTFDIVDLDRGGMIRVFCGFPLPEWGGEELEAGTVVSVTGDVGLYRGHPEVRVSGPEDFEVLGPPGTAEVAMDILFANREAFEDMTVSTHGVLLEEPDRRWSGLDMVMGSGNTEARVHVSNFTLSIPMEAGTGVRVAGRVWYEDGGHLRLQVDGYRGLTIL